MSNITYLLNLSDLQIGPARHYLTL